MHITAVLARQILIMFLLMSVGFTLHKTKKITPEGSLSIANLLLFVTMPSVLIKVFQIERSAEKVRELTVSTGLGVSAMALSMLVSYLFFKAYPIDNFSASFSNAGFIGIPLVQSVLGDSSVFYVSIFLALINILQWTYGVSVMTGKKPLTQVKSLLLNPVLLSVVLGLFLFFTELKLPAIANIAIDYLASLNAPLAMLVLGVYLGKVDWKRMLTTPRTYLCAAVRLVLIPAATLLMFKLIPADSSISLAILICAAAPVGANVAVYAQLHGQDYSYAVQTVVLSTLFSVITLPLTVELARLVWGI